MYIKNETEFLEKKFRCNQRVANHLIYTCGLPVLSIAKKKYYFATTQELRDAIDNLPLLLKLQLGRRKGGEEI